MKKYFWLSMMILTLFSQAKSQPAIEIPLGNPITVNGKMEKKEWEDALGFKLKGGGMVFFKHDGKYFYVGVSGLLNGWSQLYLTEGESSSVYVLHASAALGMTVYRPDLNGSWQPSNEFVWELRDPAITDETRKKMADYLAKNFWVANNNNMNNKNEIEFQIKPRETAKQFRLAVEYVSGEEKQFLPDGLNDDSLKSKLAFGFTATDLKFDLNQWAKISLKSKKTK